MDQWLSDCGPRYVNLSTAACELHAGLSLDLRLSHRSMKDAVSLYICKCVCVCVRACVCAQVSCKFLFQLHILTCPRHLQFFL